MDKINIQNIFGSKKKLSGQGNKKKEECLNIESIKNNFYQNNINNDYLVNKIKYVKEKDDKKLFDLYDKIYNKCLKNIDNSIDFQNTNLTFYVDMSQYGYDKYSPLECLYYIKNSLEEKDFYTYVLNENSIYISWEHMLDN